MYFYNKARTALFWGGTALILYGVIAHVPMFIHAKSMGFRMVGMPMDNTMLLGMLGIFIGLASAFYGLMRPLSAHPKGILLSDAAIEKAINNKPIGRMQRLILVLLTAAIALDIMKPATLGLVIPGMRAEYGLTESQVFLLPLVALIGTTVGSILWGLLGDRMGRRAAILLSALMFIGTSVCGAMPTFEWNLVMCGLMGMSAGGLLPITFALIAEITPNSSRGWIMVLVGGTGTSIGYLAAVQNAALLEPLFSWRSLWFAGIPSGLLLIFLNKLIPESPRFLASQGRISEAKKTLAQFGIKIDDLVLGASAREIQQEKQFDSQQPSHKAHLVSILTMGLTLCGTAWGITNFGFLLWLPENLRASGMDMNAVNSLLANSALLSLPGIVIVAWLYAKIGGRSSLIALSLFTGLSLLAFYLLEHVNNSTNALCLLICILLTATSGLIAVLVPFSAESYPQFMRATGVGLIAGSSKVGGIIGSILGAWALFTDFSLGPVVAALPLIFASLLLSSAPVSNRRAPMPEDLSPVV